MKKKDFYRYNLRLIPLTHYNKIILYIEFFKYFNNIVSNKKDININNYLYYKSLGVLKFNNIYHYDYIYVYNYLLNSFDSYKLNQLSYNFYFYKNKNSNKFYIKQY